MVGQWFVARKLTLTYEQKEEIADADKQIKRTESLEERLALKQQKAKLSQVLTEQQRSDAVRGALQQHKRKQREAVKAGKSPYFMKKSAKKEVELKAKYDHLQKKGKLDKFLQKKLKKNAQKDKKHLPFSVRPSAPT